MTGRFRTISSERIDGMAGWQYTEARLDALAFAFASAPAPRSATMGRPPANTCAILDFGTERPAATLAGLHWRPETGTEPHGWPGPMSQHDLLGFRNTFQSRPLSAAKSGVLGPTASLTPPSRRKSSDKPFRERLMSGRERRIVLMCTAITPMNALKSASHIRPEYNFAAQTLHENESSAFS